jgi:hypothetical protein
MGKARKLAMAIAVPGVALGTLAGFGVAPAMASTAQAAHHKEFKQEVIVGATGDPSGVVPVSAYGAFRDHGWIDLNGPNAGVTAIKFKHGDFRVYHDAGTAKNYFNKKTCYVATTIVSDYWVVGGTGRYKGAEGWGKAHIRFSGVLPREHGKHGKCDTDAQPVTGTTYTTFLAQGPVALDR